MEELDTSALIARMEVEIAVHGSYFYDLERGGWAAIISCDSKGKSRTWKIAGFCADTTNCRMELFASIQSLRKLKRSCHVIIRTNSTYMINKLEEKVPVWERAGWPIKLVNADLWQELAEESRDHVVECRLVHRYTGDLQLDECIKLAQNAAKHQEYLDDRDDRPRTITGASDQQDGLTQSNSAQQKEALAASAAAGLGIDPQPIHGVSTAQVDYGAGARNRALASIGLLARKFVAGGMATDEVSGLIKNAINGNAGKSAEHWIAHDRRIKKRGLDPLQYWAEFLTSVKDEQLNTPNQEQTQQGAT